MTDLSQQNRLDADAGTSDNADAPDEEDGDDSAEVSSETETVPFASTSPSADAESSRAGDPTDDAVSSVPSLARKRSMLSLRSAIAWARPLVPTVASTLGLDGLGSPKSADADTGETASRDLPRLGPPDTKRAPN